MITDLRSFLNLLEEKKDLVHISRPTSPRFEIAAGIRKTSDIEGPVMSSITSLATPSDLGGALRRAPPRHLGARDNAGKNSSKDHGRSQKPYSAAHLKDGPCKEVILTGDDADFSRLPICTHNAKDAGPFITIGLGFIRHPKYGNNVSISRMQDLRRQNDGLPKRPAAASRGLFS